VVGYIVLEHIFAANMTGNTVLLPLTAIEGRWREAGDHALSLGAFTAGAVAAALMVRAGASPALPLLVEALLLAWLGLASADRIAAIGLLSLAMGLQGAAVLTYAGIPLSSVVVTGNLVRLASVTATALLGAPADRPPRAHVALPFLTWAAYAGGAAIGVLVYRLSGNAAFLGAAATALAAAAFAHRPPRRPAG
jgi:uncharacterized membrane protein YoaK (UPF0700 family)